MVDKQTQKLIINALRQSTIAWSGRKRALERARVQIFEGKITKAGKKVLKFYWECAKCKKLFRDESSVEVDHIVEIGSFAGSWDEFIARMFCDDSNLQVLCISCHESKTTANAAVRFKRKSLEQP